MRASWGVFVLLASVALAAIPAAHADVRVAFDGMPSAPIKPEIESPSFTVTVEADCKTVLERAGLTNSQIPVSTTFAAPAGVFVSGSMSSMLATEPCLNGADAVSVSADFQITLGRALPALQAVSVAVGVALPPSQLPADFSDSGEASADFAVSAAPYLVSQVTTAQSLKACSCQRIGFNMTVANLGNARTTFTFELASLGSVGQPLNASLAHIPEPLTLESPATGGKSMATVEVLLDLPGGGRSQRETTLQVRVNSFATDDPAAIGDQHTANFLARKTLGGAGQDAAAPVAPLMLLGLLLAAVLERRPRGPQR